MGCRGSLHPTPQDWAQSPRRGEAAYAFRPSADPRLNQYQLDGTWAREEALVLRSSSGRLRVRFSAAKLHLVAGAPQAAALRVSAVGSGPRTVKVWRPTLYTLLDGEACGEHPLEFEAETPGLSLFSATFGQPRRGAHTTSASSRALNRGVAKSRNARTFSGSRPPPR
jgi:hypothetical protein